MDGDRTLIEASPTDGGTEMDQLDPIHGKYLLLDQVVQFIWAVRSLINDITAESWVCASCHVSMH